MWSSWKGKLNEALGSSQSDTFFIPLILKNVEIPKIWKFSEIHHLIGQCHNRL